METHFSSVLCAYPPSQELTDAESAGTEQSQGSRLRCRQRRPARASLTRWQRDVAVGDEGDELLRTLCHVAAAEVSRGEDEEQVTVYARQIAGERRLRQIALRIRIPIRIAIQCIRLEQRPNRVVDVRHIVRMCRNLCHQPGGLIGPTG